MPVIRAHEYDITVYDRVNKREYRMTNLHTKMEIGYESRLDSISLSTEANPVAELALTLGRLRIRGEFEETPWTRITLVVGDPIRRLTHKQSIARAMGHNA